MGFRRKLTASVLSLLGGAATCTAFYAVRFRQFVYADAVSSPTDGNMTPINVQIFFRHGARTPLTTITGLDEVCMSKDVVLCRPGEGKHKYIANSRRWRP